MTVHTSGAIALGVLLLAAGWRVQAADAAAATHTLEEVIVTGTFVSRSVFESMAPIDVITAQELQLTGSDELMDALAQLVPSFNVQRLPMADGQVFVRPARLRNLSPDHTLVLVNGKRRHRSALLGSNGAQAPDLAQIPTAAIKRIEVLRDGASAQYGSDAIAGVINIILEDEAGVDAFAQYGQYRDGDGDQYRAGLRAGAEFGAGFVSGTLEIQESDPTSRSRQRADAEEFQAQNPHLDVPDPVQRWGQPERESYRLVFNGGYNLNAAELYSFGSYGESEGVSDFNWRNPLSTSAYAPSPAYPGFDLGDIYPVGFAPRFGQEDRDLALVVGLRGPDTALGWDLSAGVGENEIDYFIDNTINASLGADSPTSFRPGTLVQTQTNLNADFSWSMDLPALAAPLAVAFGAEWRQEAYRIRAGDEASWAIGPAAQYGLPSGSNGFPGYSEDQAGRFEQRSHAAYLDLDLALSRNWTLGMALRYEDFSEYGDTVDGKLAARYQMTPEFALRATVSTGFRAPTPGQLFSERTSQGLDTETLNIFTAGRFSPQGAVAEVLNERVDVSIDSLDAEESENLSAGLAWERGGLSLTLDFYQIDVDNRFGSSQTFTPTAAEQARFVELGVPGGEGITRVSFFQNDFDTTTRGADLVASYSVDLGAGMLDLGAAYNYNKTSVEDGNLSANETERLRFEKLLPQHTGNLSASYSVGRLDLGGRLRYYGEWTDYSANAQGDIFQDFGAEYFVDLSAAYRLTDAVTLRLAAENVFDSYPDEADFQASRGLVYSRNAPYDTDGSFYYLRVDMTL